MSAQLPLMGDIIRIKRTDALIEYWHWAVFVSTNEVIHYTSAESDLEGELMIQATGFDHFLRGETTFEIVAFPDSYSKSKSVIPGLPPISSITASTPLSVFSLLLSACRTLAATAEIVNTCRYKLADADEVVTQARSRCGEKKYNKLFNNCEHFAVWCKTGLSESEQTAFWKYLLKIPALQPGKPSMPIIRG